MRNGSEHSRDSVIVKELAADPVRPREHSVLQGEFVRTVWQGHNVEGRIVVEAPVTQLRAADLGRAEVKNIRRTVT